MAMPSAKDSHDCVEGAVEAALAVHVLPVLALAEGVDGPHVVVLHLFILGRVEPTEPHNLHQVNLLLRFSVVFVLVG